jgi:hypothetical protein
MSAANPAVSDPNPDNLEADNQSVLLDEAVKPTVPAAPTAPDDADGDVVYEPTGDVGLDLALDFVGKAGIPSTHPAMVAASSGDFSILKATLAAKGVQGWEQFVALGEQAYQKTVAATEAKSKALREAVHKEAGGPEEWAAVQKWAGANATQEEKAEINNLLNQGGLQAKLAVQYLVSAYGRANNVTREPKDPTANATRGGVPGASDGPLSPKDYAEAVRSLNNKLHGRLEGSREYEQLQRRRAAYRG